MTDEPKDWSQWRPLIPGTDHGMSPNPGLYRIRRAWASRLDYVGQTGRSLRGRLAQLRGIFGEIMPYNDPHTAGPGLWALRQDGADGFEVSITEVSGSKSHRMGLEALAITLHRVEHGASPTLQFGRMPAGWKKSSGNTKRLAEQGKRYRGGLDATYVPPPSIPVPGAITGEPRSEDWLSLDWSPWTPLGDEQPAIRLVGVYRIGSRRRPGLIYVGQGRVGSRLKSHVENASRKADGPWTALSQPGCEVSWVALDAHPAQVLEIENDLIAAHVLTQHVPPSAQFNA